MADIKTITPIRPVNAECVAFLRNLLELAEKGEIMHVAVVSQYYDRSTGSGWSAGDDVYRTTVLGAIESLKLDYYERVVRG